MKVSALIEGSNVKQKAGLIPYFVSGGKVEMLFMITSDARFGGLDPMIAKGHIDKGENAEEAAIREASEELGYKPSNAKGKLFKVDDFHSASKMGYPEKTEFFAVEVKNKKDFGQFHYETASTHWMTNEEFQKRGRDRHKPIVQKLSDMIK